MARKQTKIKPFALFRPLRPVLGTWMRYNFKKNSDLFHTCSCTRFRHESSLEKELGFIYHRVSHSRIENQHILINGNHTFCYPHIYTQLYTNKHLHTRTSTRHAHHNHTHTRILIIFSIVYFIILFHFFIHLLFVTIFHGRVGLLTNVKFTCK